jgi:hypothetical protein
MQGWNEYMCGAEIPVEESDQNYRRYCEKNLERLDIMVKNDVRGVGQNCHRLWAFWGILSLSEEIFNGVVEEFCYSFFI